MEITNGWLRHYAELYESKAASATDRAAVHMQYTATASALRELLARRAADEGAVTFTTKIVHGSFGQPYFANDVVPENAPVGVVECTIRRSVEPAGVKSESEDFDEHDEPPVRCDPW